MIDHFSPRARPANFEEHQIVHCASEDEWRWVAVAFQGERRARLRRTGPNALRPVPGQVEPVALNDPHRDRAPHRTSYVCGSFLIDRFWLSVLNAARQHQGKASLAAGDAWRATVPPGSSSEVLPAVQRVRAAPGELRKTACYDSHMMNSRTVVESLSSSDLLSATRELVHKSRGVEAELLVHLGEIDERRLYLDRAFSSMFAFCVGELGFSEDAAYSRIHLARAARRLPVILEAVRSGQVHLTGLRLL